MELSYEALRKVQLQERNFGALSKLEDGFYEAYNLWLLEQKRAVEIDFSLERVKTYENAKKIVAEISEKREQKILLKALKDLKNGSVESEGLAKEEKSLYLELLKSLQGFEATVLTAQEQAPKTVVSKHVDGTQPQETQVAAALEEQVRMLKPLSEFVGVDGKTYGPYLAGDLVSLSKDVASIFVKKNIAEWAKAAGKKELRESVESMDGMDANGNGNASAASSGDSAASAPDAAIVEKPLSRTRDGIEIF